MKSSITKLLCLAALMLGTVFASAADSRPRVIVTTDGELDDQSSMVRFLMFASDYDIAGIEGPSDIRDSQRTREAGSHHSRSDR